MLYADFPLAELKSEFERRQVPDTQLLAKLVGQPRRQAALAGDAAKAEQIDQLIELGAWTEAALALLRLALPQWKLRRLLCQDGIWSCSLSRIWNGPDWLADEVESRHEMMPMAILCALLEAQEFGPQSSALAVTSVPRCGRTDADATPADIMCCDNFS